MRLWRKNISIQWLQIYELQLSNNKNISSDNNIKLNVIKVINKLLSNSYCLCYESNKIIIHFNVSICSVSVYPIQHAILLTKKREIYPPG